MTSQTICPKCQGQVCLHENEVSDMGKVWKTFSGTCPQCGYGINEYPPEYYAELDRIEEEEARTRDDGYWHGAVGCHDLVKDEDREKCIAKLMYSVWKKYQPQFQLVRAGKIERDWTYREAEEEGWFNYCLILDRWYPINGGDDTEHYEERLCLQNLEQVRKYLDVGRLSKWTLTKRGRDHRTMTFSGNYPKGGLDQVLEVFA